MGFRFFGWIFYNVMVILLWGILADCERLLFSFAAVKC